MGGCLFEHGRLFKEILHAAGKLSRVTDENVSDIPARSFLSTFRTVEQ